MSEAGWGTDKPTAPGYYWFRDREKGPLILSLGWDLFDSSKLLILGRFNQEKLAQWDGEWLGPITPDASAAGRVAHTCAWKYDDIDDYYETSCKNAYCLVDGTLEENEHRYCPFCGGKIEAQAQGGEHGNRTS